MNDIKLLGRLSKDTHIRKTTDDVSVCFGTLAVTRPNTKTSKTDFIEFMAYDKDAENLNKYNSKGDEILVEAEIRSYTQNGKTMQSVIATKITYLRRAQKNIDKSVEDKVSKIDTSQDDVVEETKPKDKETFVDKVAGYFK